MDSKAVSTVDNVTLARRGFYVTGTLILAPHHLVFRFFPPAAVQPVQPPQPREVWVCYPIIERISRGRGSSWMSSGSVDTPPLLHNHHRHHLNLHSEPSAQSAQSDAARAGSASTTATSTTVTNTPITSSMLNLTGNLHETPPNKHQQRPSAQPAPGDSLALMPSLPDQHRSHTQSARMAHYLASHIRIQCKDFTFYSFDFVNDTICLDVFQKISAHITAPKSAGDVLKFYAFHYQPNMLESALGTNGWALYDAMREYQRLGLTSATTQNDNSAPSGHWRVSRVNEEYAFCPSYPRYLAVPASISDNVLKHAGKFRSKQRIPAVVYRHRAGANGNVIARCAQPLVGLKQNRSLQDEKLVGEIFLSQDREKTARAPRNGVELQQLQRNLIVDLRPLTNAVAQHALGAGTESIDNYRNRPNGEADEGFSNNNTVDKIFCNIDNIHVMRDSLNKLSLILNDLDKFPIKGDANGAVSSTANGSGHLLLQQSLTKTQWLHRLSIILQSVDRISKSVHLNNTNVLIHCSDGWDRTSQVSALLQLCLDPYYRTLEGFMVLVEKEWVSFGFKFATRSDHGGCIGAKYKPAPVVSYQADIDSQDSELPPTPTNGANSSASNVSNANTANNASNAAKVASFFQRAATHIKNTAVSASTQASELEIGTSEDGKLTFSTGGYSGSNEKSPIFHQFLDCVYQLYRQHPTRFEFNSRFLKRLFYHHYSCQYGSFLSNSEREMNNVNHIRDGTVSVWDYFNSRTAEFTNPQYIKAKDGDPADDGVLFFNYTDIKWWYELYGRTDEEMNGLSNSLDRKFAQMKLGK